MVKYLKGIYSGYHLYNTGGGMASIQLIIESIGLKENQFLLLPSYLCKSILIPLRKLGVKIRYYAINSDLSINLKSLFDQVNANIGALFIIDYFGFVQSELEISAIRDIQSRGVLVIKDSVQSMLTDQSIHADYIFNSFRKYLPLDGSLIATNHTIMPKQYTYGGYLLKKYYAQMLRACYYMYKLPTEKISLDYFRRAESDYEQSGCLSMPPITRTLLQWIDVKAIVDRHKRNYKRMLSYLHVVALYKTLPDNVVPLGFPLMLTDRDNIRNQLMEIGVYCPVHWELPHEIKLKKYPESHYLSNMMLTLPLSNNISQSLMDKIVRIISSEL